MFKSLCFAFLLLTCYAHAQIGTNWVLKENSRGIKIFTGDVETSKVKAIRVQCEVEATLSQVVAMLMDNGYKRERRMVVPYLFQLYS